MNLFELDKGKDKNLLAEIYFEYSTIIFFALGLLACVIASYYFSRFIPAELFQSTISPILHVVMLVTVVIGAIVMQRHICGIRARRMWQVVLISWAILEVIMLLAGKIFDLPTIIYEVFTLQRSGMVARDLLACLLLFYPMEVLLPKWLNVRRMLLMMIPPFIIWGLDYLLEEDMRVLLIVYPIIIAFYLIVHVRVHRAKCEENYSSLENTAIKWVRKYLTTLIIIGLSYFYLCFTNHPTRFFTQQWLILFLFVMNTAQIVVRRKPWLEETDSDEPVEGLSFPAEYKTNFEAWMEQDKPYLNKDFRLTDLMQVLPLNRTYLSQFINAEYGCNFYQLVTTYRINEAKRLMCEYPELKMKEIAEQSGFSSPVVFARTFARKTGCTPTEWQQQNKDR